MRLMQTPIEEKFLALVKKIEEVGKQARAYFDADDTRNDIKHDGSVVTAVDQSIERMLRDYIAKEFPGDAIVGEEGVAVSGHTGFVWHIDPIDGTDNFLRKIPFCAVSVARLGDTSEDSFGIVHNPITGQTFSSLMENGVYENERVHILNDELLGGRAVVTIARGKESWMKSASYNLRKAIGLELGKCDPLGCCALEIAYVAANRIDGVLTFGLNSWDYAAGLYLVRAGGGSISHFKDGGWQLWTGELKPLCEGHGKTMFISHQGIHNKALAIIGDPSAWTDE
jgi:myo-inositol-1(or 4)-monophosphatase